MVRITIMTSTLEMIASLETGGAEGMTGCLVACCAAFFYLAWDHILFTH